MWLDFLSKYNGRTIILDSHLVHSSVLHLYTDAAATKGYSCIFRNMWFVGKWPLEWKSYNVTLLEFYPIVVALFIFAKDLQNRRIIFHTDNQSLVHVINKQTSKEPLLMCLMRKFVLQSLTCNTLVKAKHVPGYDNTIADLLSRFQVQQAFLKAPWLCPDPVQVPDRFLPQNFLQPI